MGVLNLSRITLSSVPPELRQLCDLHRQGTGAPLEAWCRSRQPLSATTVSPVIGHYDHKGRFVHGSRRRGVHVGDGVCVVGLSSSHMSTWNGRHGTVEGHDARKKTFLVDI